MAQYAYLPKTDGKIGVALASRQNSGIIYAEKRELLQDSL